jgi:hypothetical protein
MAIQNVHNIVSCLFKSFGILTIIDCYQFLEYHSARATRSMDTARTNRGKGTAPPATTSADEVYGLSRRLAASQARRAQEVSSDDPYGELERYLNDPLEPTSMDILDFWMVRDQCFMLFIQTYLY